MVLSVVCIGMKGRRPIQEGLITDQIHRRIRRAEEDAPKEPEITKGTPAPPCKEAVSSKSSTSSALSPRVGESAGDHHFRMGDTVDQDACMHSGDPFLGLASVLGRAFGRMFFSELPRLPVSEAGTTPT